MIQVDFHVVKTGFDGDVEGSGCCSLNFGLLDLCLVHRISENFSQHRVDPRHFPRSRRTVQNQVRKVRQIPPLLVRRRSFPIGLPVCGRRSSTAVRVYIIGIVLFVLFHRVFEVLVIVQKKLVGFFDVGLGLGFDNRLLDGFFVHFHLPLFDVGLGFDKRLDYQIIVAVL